MDKKILIGVPTAEYARRADFYDYFNMLDKSQAAMQMFTHGQSPARNRNIIIRSALDNNCTHILFLDDDVAFQSDLLSKLVSHDKDIVTGLYLMRNYPHQPIIFDKTDDDGRCRHFWLTPERTGLVEIVACGLGCCLISTSIFKDMEEPWIRLGELEKDHWCDDIGFLRRLRALNKYKMYCDLDVRVGHVGSMIIWPDYAEGKWMSRYDTSGTGSAFVPQSYPSVEELVGVE